MFLGCSWGVPHVLGVLNLLEMMVDENQNESDNPGMFQGKYLMKFIAGKELK